MNDGNPKIRAFIAICLPEDIKFSLQGLQVNLQKSGIKASWSKPANLHLTLKFLGYINTNEMDRVKKCMLKAVTGTPVHILSASGIGVFPSSRKARIIWSGTSGQTGVLIKLAHRLGDILFEDMGIQKENFSPHLTIARVKQSIPPKKMTRLLQKFENFQSKDFPVFKLHLYQSELRSSGAVHDIIFSAPLDT